MKHNVYQLGIVGFGGIGNRHYEFLSGRGDWHGRQLYSIAWPLKESTTSQRSA